MAERGPAGPGVLRRGPGRRPAGGGPQALRLGPGPAGRRSSSSTAPSCSTGSRSTSSTCSPTPRRRTPRTRATRICGPSERDAAGARGRDGPPGPWPAALVRGFETALDVTFASRVAPLTPVGQCRRPSGGVSTSGSGCSLVRHDLRPVRPSQRAGARFCSSCGSALVEARRPPSATRPSRTGTPTAELAGDRRPRPRARASSSSPGARTRAAPTWSTRTTVTRRAPPRVEHLPRRHHGLAPPLGHRAGRRRVPDPGRRLAQRHLREPRPGRPQARSSDGDEIQVGRFVLIFRVGGA